MNIFPILEQDSFYCKDCNIKCSKKYNFERHKLSRKHLVTINILPKEKKNINLNCNTCNMIFTKKSVYDSHILTNKHKKKISNIDSNKKIYKCNCGNKYNAASSLSRHKHNCNNSKPNVSQINSELFTKLLEQNIEALKQNNEFKDLIDEKDKVIMELSKKLEESLQSNSLNTL